MKPMNKFLVALPTCMLALAVSAAVKVEVTFSNGAARQLTDPVFRNGTVVLTAENIAVPFSGVQKAVFSFDALSKESCDELLRSGDYQGALTALALVLDPVREAAVLPGNIDDFIFAEMRAAFWTGKYDLMRRDFDVLQAKKSGYAPLAGLYRILAFSAEGNSSAAAEAFRVTADPEKISAPMSRYIQARLSCDAEDYKQALQQIAQVIVYYGRDPEWLPAATFLEGLVYQKTGKAEAMENVAEELKRAYPSTYWGLRAGELK